jgi:uncharacterized protein (DUF433 family)
MSVEIDIQQFYTDLSDIKEMLRGMQKAMGQLAEMASLRVQTEHPHIVRIEGVCGGRPFIAGTRISVRTIVERMRLSDSPEQIVENYPPLTLAQVYDALSYYHEHESEIEAEIAANEEALAWVTRRSSG